MQPPFLFKCVGLLGVGIFLRVLFSTVYKVVSKLDHVQCQLLTWGPSCLSRMNRIVVRHILKRQLYHFKNNCPLVGRILLKNYSLSFYILYKLVSSSKCPLLSFSWFCITFAWYTDSRLLEHASKCWCEGWLESNRPELNMRTFSNILSNCYWCQAFVLVCVLVVLTSFPGK